MSNVKACEVCGLTNAESPYVHYCKKAGKVLCNKHRQIFRYNGVIREYSIFDKNNFRIHDDYAEIELRNKKQEIVGYALIDIVDVEKCRNHKWNIDCRGYVKSRINNVSVSLHRFVLNYYGNEDIDHINRNKLDNRTSNLRIVSRSENNVNVEPRSNTGQKNINVTRSNTYRVKINRNGCSVYVKIFKTLEEAIKARDDFLTEYNYIHNRAC